MRAVKLVLLVALVAGGWQLWNQREFVVSAYTDERDPLALELNGVSAVPITSARSESPYALAVAGTGRAPTHLRLDTGDDAEPETVELTGGTVTLDGSVLLPDGTPVAGATIRIERFTTAGQAVGETVSDDDGNWEVVGLRAGRLRIRAFAPNLLASVDPVVIVLSHAGSATIALQVQAAAPAVTYELVGPAAVAIDAEVTVAVVASRELVDENGRLVRVPMPNESLLMSVSPPARLLSANPVTTDAGGAARFLVVCDGEGTPTSSVQIDTVRSTLALPACLTIEALAELEAAASAEAEADVEVEP